MIHKKALCPTSRGFTPPPRSRPTKRTYERGAHPTLAPLARHVVPPLLAAFAEDLYFYRGPINGRGESVLHASFESVRPITAQSAGHFGPCGCCDRMYHPCLSLVVAPHCAPRRGCRLLDVYVYGCARAHSRVRADTHACSSRQSASIRGREMLEEAALVGFFIRAQQARRRHFPTALEELGVGWYAKSFSRARVSVGRHSYREQNREHKGHVKEIHPV